MSIGEYTTSQENNAITELRMNNAINYAFYVVSAGRNIKQLENTMVNSPGNNSKAVTRMLI